MVLLRYQEVDIAKARQLGISWVVAGYGLWCSLFNNISKNLYLSQGEQESYELLSKTRFIYDNLPDWMKKELKNDTRSVLSFKGTSSEIKALPATEKAGSGYNATLVVRDELYNHPYGELNFAYIAPSMDAGGQMVNLSAVYGDDLDNHFVVRLRDFAYLPGTEKRILLSGLELYTNDNYPSRCMVFLGWRLRPVRQEGMELDDFYKILQGRYSPFDLDRQYPSALEDCFRVSAASNFFDMKALEEMELDLNAPIKQHDVDTYNGMVRVYKPPVSGKRYVLFTDPSDGVEDPFVTVVMDYVTGEIVCSATGKIKVDKVAALHDYLSRQYNATNSYEINGTVGGSMGTCLNELETPKQAPRYKTDGSIDPGKRGQTVSGGTSGGHKNKILGDLAFAITKRLITVHDREFTQQCKLVTRDEQGNPVTSRRKSFDWVLAMAGVWQLQKYAPRTPAKIVTYTMNTDGSYSKLQTKTAVR